MDVAVTDIVDNVVDVEENPHTNPVGVVKPIYEETFMDQVNNFCSYVRPEKSRKIPQRYRDNENEEIANITSKFLNHQLVRYESCINTQEEFESKFINIGGHFLCSPVAE